MPIFYLFSYAKGYRLNRKGRLAEGRGTPKEVPHCFGIVRAPTRHLAYCAAILIAGHEDCEALRMTELDEDQESALDLFLKKNRF